MALASNMKIQIILLILLLLCTNTGKAQIIEMVDTTGKVVVIIDSDRVRDAGTNKALLTVKGNLIFLGNSDNQKDIILLVKANDIFSKKSGEVLSKNLDKVYYTVYNGRFFLGKTSMYNPDFQIGYFKYENEDQPLRFYEGNSENWLVEIYGEDISTGKLVALFYLLTDHYGLDEKVSSRIKTEVPIGPSVGNTSGTIRRLWDTGVDAFGQTIR